MKKHELSKTALSLTIALLVSSGFLTQALAQNVVVKQNDLVTEKTTIVNGSFTEIGNSQNGLPAIKGFAKDLPLIAVLKQITPNDWVVKRAKGKSLDLQRQVSWSGGQTWNLTLKTVVEANGLDAVINWDKKEVVLSETEVQQPMVVTAATTPVIQQVSPVATAKVTKTVGVFELSTDVVTQGNSGQVETVAAKEETKSIPEAVKSVIKTWNYEGKNNLKEVVLDWGKVAGYKVVFTGENYPLNTEDSRVLSGDFDAEDGPIKQLATDYGPESRVKQPLSFIFYQNKTLVVENLRFEQSGYPQYLQK